MLDKLKKFFLNPYTALFIYVPVLSLPFTMIPLLWLFERSNSVEMNLLLLLAMLIASLPIAALGFFLARKWRGGVFTRYFCVFALPLYTVFAAIAAFMISGIDFVNGYFLNVVGITLPLFIISSFICAFGGEYELAPLIPFISYVALGAGFWLGSKKYLKRKNLFILSTLFIVSLIVWATLWQIDRARYLPANILRLPKAQSADLVAVPLRGEAALQFENGMPRMDAATALCPLLYSAASAMAPQSDLYSYRHCSGTIDAYDNLIDDRKDMIFVAAPSDEQKKQAKEKGLHLSLNPIGREAFVFIVNDANPLRSLTLQNIRDIYSGKIRNWKELGGADEKIFAFQRNYGSGSQTAMLQMVMKDTPLMRAPEELVNGFMSGLIESVASYRNAKNAIGYTFRHYATKMVVRDHVRLLAIDGIEPTKENIANGKYPLSTEFFIVTARPLSQKAQALIQWFSSSQGQALIEDVGYVPLNHP